MVVAVGIFSIVSVVIAQLFTTFTRTQQRAGINQKIQSDARVMMAQISDRIRSAEINYDAYGGQIPVPTDDLWIIDENGLEVVIRRSDVDFANTTCPSAASTPCLEISEDGGVTFYPMTTENYTVDSAQFFISPETDPSSGGLDIQPRVTFSLGIRNASPDAVLQAPTYVQSTVSARVYPGSAGITIPAAPVTSICGNGVIEGSEQCDDGNTTGGDGCSAVCQNELIAVCGDGNQQGAEQCDDGNTSNGDGCSSTCFIETVACGNGFVESGEACDDGNTTDAGVCNATCTAFTFCGDNVVQSPNGDGTNEICDDGNDVNGDGCDNCLNACTPIDGGWSSWSGWSTCSEICGGGTQTRSRVCNNPSPNACGAACPGSTQESQACNTQPCCTEVNYAGQPVLSGGNNWFWSDASSAYFYRVVIPNNPPPGRSYQYAKVVIPFQTTCSGSWCNFWQDLGGGQGTSGSGPQTGTGYSYSTTTNPLTIYSTARWNRWEPSGVPTNASITYTQGTVRFCYNYF